jgi:hypothetical protein
MKINCLISCFLLFYSGGLLAQDQETKPRGNLPNYFNEKWNFGFTLGVNRANFRIDYADHFERFDSLKTVESKPKYGFNLGIVSELRLHKYVLLRFVPNISFAERNLQYYFEGKKDTIIKDKSIESTFLNFPLDLKLRSKRLGNFDAYLVAGGGYSLDLASKRKTKNSSEPDEQIVRLKRDDFSYEAGVGFEFYLEYFKFAVEGKMINGTKNLIIKDNTIFSNPIDKLNSKIFLISITFEG